MWTNKKMIITAVTVTILALVLFQAYKHFYPAHDRGSPITATKTPLDASATPGGSAAAVGGPVAIPPLITTASAGNDKPSGKRDRIPANKGETVN